MGTIRKSLAKLSTVLARASVEYLADVAADEAGTGPAYPYSPARATAALAKRYAPYPASRLVGPVADVYYRENGLRSPLAFARVGKDGLPTPAAIAASVAKARKAGGRLARWEVLAYRLAAGLGRDPGSVSVASVRAYAAKGGVAVGTADYAGRGTRAGAPDTRTDETAEIDAALASSEG